MIVSNSKKVTLNYRILTSHLNLLWYDNDYGVVYIQGCLIRHSEYGIIPDELDIKNVFNLNKGIRVMVTLSLDI